MGGGQELNCPFDIGLQLLLLDAFRGLTHHIAVPDELVDGSLGTLSDLLMNTADEVPCVHRSGLAAPLTVFERPQLFVPLADIRNCVPVHVQGGSNVLWADLLWCLKTQECRASILFFFFIFYKPGRS